MKMKRVSFKKIESDWLRFESENSSTKIFQYYDIVQNVLHHYLFFTIERKEFPRFYAFYENEKCVAIAPMCKRYARNGAYYTSFGAIADLAFQNFVYGNELSIEQFDECMKLLYKRLKRIRFYRVPEETYLNDALKDNNIEIKNNINVAIECENDYDHYFTNLSKSVRQNIRTAYNRIKKDGLEYDFNLYSSGNVTLKESNEIMDVYIKRRKNNYGLRYNVKIQEWFLRHYHYNTIGFRKLEEGMYAVLKINGQVAAFWGGYVDRNRRYVIVPRLAINDEYYKYSPGYLLINETMKILKKEYGVPVLDLSKGDEKYKYDLGGKAYSTYDYLVES
ncbi:hypothetical protein SANA_29110 [Gottschalkiaceae bacterium SANA]|nr:hypothetical protein SANA_29110 [Gottschalkiaceae bacterium SANA]